MFPIQKQILISNPLVCIYIYYSIWNPQFHLALRNFLIQLQLELNAFRAQWMSELKPSSEASGVSNQLLRATGLQSKQEIALEEKVSCQNIPSGHLLTRTVECCRWTLQCCWMIDVTHLPSGHRAVLESCSGRAERSWLWRYVSIVNEGRKWWINYKKNYSYGINRNAIVHSQNDLMEIATLYQIFFKNNTGISYLQSVLKLVMWMISTGMISLTLIKVQIKIKLSNFWMGKGNDWLHWLSTSN